MISLIEKGKITDLQGNLLTSSQQSVLNWTPAGAGTVDLSFDDVVNHFEFSNYGASSAKARFKEEYEEIYSKPLQDAWADYFLTIWKNKGGTNWPESKYLYTYDEDGFYSFMQVNDPNRILSNGKLQVYSGDEVNAIYRTQFEQNRVSTYYSGSSNTFQIPTTYLPHYWGSYEDWLSSITKNYTLSFKSSDATVPTYQEMLAWSGINSAYMSENSYNSFIRDCNTKFGAGNWTICAFAGNYGLTMEPLYIYAYNISLYMEALFDGTYSNRDYRVALFPNGIQQTYQTYMIRYAYRYIDGATYSTRPYADLDTTNGGIKKWKNWGASSKNYLLTLSTRSTTGFTKDASKHDITLTNGNNTYTLEVSPTASQEYQQQNILFTPTSASCSLKLDLSGMQGSGIEIDVKDIGVYEIGGEE